MMCSSFSCFRDRGVALLVAWLILSSGACTPWLRSFSVARADWLELLPPCAIGAASEPSFAVVYPRPGLPALVAAGALLTVRVRVPAALTPPPGAQQPAVLAPWSAQLSGRVLPVLGDKDEAAVYPLPVVDLRPDDPSGLVYRLSLPVPAWTAPGSYDLWVRGPGGNQRHGASVFVRAPEVWPRLAVHVPQAEAPAEGALSPSVLRLGREVPSRMSATVRPAEVGYAVVRYSGGLFELGSDLACARESKSLRRGLEAATGLPFRGHLRDRVGRARSAAVAPPAVSVDAQPSRVIVTTSGPSGGSRPLMHLRFAVPSQPKGYRVRGARAHAFYPIGEWHGRLPERLALWVALVRGSTLEVSTRDQSEGPPGASPATPAPLLVGSVGEAIRVNWRAPSADARLAVRLSARETHYASSVLEVVPGAAGSRLLTGIAIGRSGEVSRVRARLASRPARQGCSLGGTSGSKAPGRFGLVSWSATFLLLLALLKRRAMRPSGIG